MDSELYYLLCAAAIGAVIGLEREYKNKTAGLRTMIMVSMASCLFTILSRQIGEVSDDRIAANILTGLGFLCAGVIFKDENRISGITTATTIWMVAALGMAIGAGYIALGLYGTILVLLILSLLTYLEKMVEEFNLIRDYKMICHYEQGLSHYYEQLFKQYGLKAKHVLQVLKSDEIILHWNISGKRQRHDLLVEELSQDPRIKRLSF
ncbi:MAG TPA: MgtC/SapB family protein [Acinetobacter radioresistens]|jgi:putative Mg2+ transporter-C (MgtC) family protein|uniref:Protein MgtC n=1 Tax=Acinetobacter radioresistens TaxID=40216 RepID=A0A3A4CJE2_ACIRA|nr:MgtC/SapB family protein [Acinetobacter radioresistens]MCK4081631.1 MgtC/SapB family protein [Acinetobacter radioresistens]MCM1936013.1 MgtC/SapB family protein [Acinetobacter radioresistens]MCM1953764.1 MgtC/SapB family protein [Acinetobacter radioresistens]MCU4308367.1 MgtC/SapB family protein [Acinetobacter radioresistens]MCU4501222.1 MgtC/SapB family protein [Acinetobacter radioresistens]